MSQSPSTSASRGDHQSLFDNALNIYKKNTRKDLRSHPLRIRLESCRSPDAVLTVLREQFDRSRSGDERLTRWLNPTVDVLWAFSEALGATVNLTPSPTVMVFAGIGALLPLAVAAKTGQDTLIDLFEHIERSFRRLGTLTGRPLTTGTTDTIVKSMAELLIILAIAARGIKSGRMKKWMKKVAGRTDIEDALQRLDKLVPQEGRVATPQVPTATRGVRNEDEVHGFDGRGGSGMIGVGEGPAVVIDDGGRAREQDQQKAKEISKEISKLRWDRFRDDLIRWLYPPDPSPNFYVSIETLHEGTTLWFIEGSTFQDWKASGSLLWIHGKPGSGKSVLTSAIIQAIKNDISVKDDVPHAPPACMAHFFFDFRDSEKQDTRALLSSLIVQLGNQSESFHDILFTFHSAHDSGSQQPSDDELFKCLKNMLSVSDPVPIYIVIDALDECPSMTGILPPRDEVLALVTTLVNLNLPNLRLCITSRPEIDIRMELGPLASTEISLHDEPGQATDIADYVNSFVYSDRLMRKWRDDDKKLVIEMLTQKADGMFRWVICQLIALRRSLPSSIRRVIEELPRSLDETYERVLLGISESNQEVAQQLLQCLVVSLRPLRVEELAEVLAIDFDDRIPRLDVTRRWEDPEHAVLSICSSLVAVVKIEDSRVVQFSHFSVKEFLTSDRLVRSSRSVSRYYVPIGPAHTTMAQACLSVLLQLDYHTDDKCIDCLPLARYAAQHWADHAKFENVSSQILDQVDRFLDPDNPHLSAWLWLSRRNRSWRTGTHPTPLEATPLLYMAEHGFTAVLPHLTSTRPQDVHFRDGLYGTPLHAALHRGHVEAYLLLLQHFDDVDVRDSVGQTTLHLAASYGHPEVLQVLIERGADINARDDAGETPLHAALKYITYKSGPNNSLIVIRFLLERGANANAQNNADWTPLHRASCYGSLEATQLLLGHDAVSHVRNSDGKTPLHNALRPSVVRSLLEHGADADAQDDDGLTALHVASSEGKLELIRILLEHGANVHVQNTNGQTASEVASALGHQAIVQVLSEYEPQSAVK